MSAQPLFEQFNPLDKIETDPFYVSSRRRQMTVMTSGITGQSSLFNIFLWLTTMKHQRSALLSLCEGNPPVTGGFPHKGRVTRKMCPFDDVIMMLKLHHSIHRETGFSVVPIPTENKHVVFIHYV